MSQRSPKRRLLAAAKILNLPISHHPPMKPIAAVQAVDISIVGGASVVQFQPLIVTAQSWVAGNIQLDPWQWLRATFCVDHRCTAALIAGMQNAGMVVPS